MEGNLPFLPCFTLYLRAISKYKPSGGLIFGGAYTWRGLFSEFYGISERKQKTFLGDARQSEVVFFHFWTVVLSKFLDKSSL